MAIIKLNSTKSASRAINYAEKRAVSKSAVGCSINYAKSAFKAVRTAFGKDDKIQAHTIIQSFSPTDKLTPALANKIGFELAKSVAKNHQVVVFTHNDTEHIHNHIIINAVNYETGKKYRSTNKQRELIMDKSNELCEQNNLSTTKRKKLTGDTKTLAEIALKNKNKVSFKDKIRDSINNIVSRLNPKNYDEFDEYLQKYNIKIARKTKKTLTYQIEYVDDDQTLKVRKSRADKLGASYDMTNLDVVFLKNQKEYEQKQKQEQKKRADKFNNMSYDEQQMTLYKGDWGNSKSSTSSLNADFNKNKDDGLDL